MNVQTLCAIDRVGALAAVADHHQSRVGLLQHSRQNLNTINRTFDGPKV